MNSRINELAKLAGLNCDPALIEAFARLVATDCMDIAIDSGVDNCSYSGLNKTYIAGMKNGLHTSATRTSNLIKWRFGVIDPLAKYLEIFRGEEAADRLLEYAYLIPKEHGIPDVVLVLWLSSLGIVVQVSNAKNEFDETNNFVIQRPNLAYEESHVAAWIKQDKLAQIKEWLITNDSLLSEVETAGTSEITTSEFINKMSKV